MSKEERQNGEKKIYKWDPKKRRKEENRGARGVERKDRSLRGQRFVFTVSLQ